MTKSRATKFKRIIAMVLMLAMVVGMTPMQSAASEMEVTFASFDGAGGVEQIMTQAVDARNFHLLADKIALVS